MPSMILMLNHCKHYTFKQTGVNPILSLKNHCIPRIGKHQ